MTPLAGRRPSRPFLDSLALSLHSDRPQTRCFSPKGWTKLECECGSTVYIPLRCRHCVGCANWARAKLIARVMAGSEGQEDLAFLTLTSLPSATWPFLMKRWSQFVVWLRRRCPDLQYVCAKEEGPTSGMKHLHVVCMGWRYIPWADLSSRWARYTGAWNLAVKLVPTQRAARYVAKHYGKTDALSRKNVSFSRGWPKLVIDRPRYKAEMVWAPPEPEQCFAVTRNDVRIEFIASGCTCFNHLEEFAALNWTMKDRRRK